MGYIYFLIGNLEQATYFHERSVNSLLEDKKSQTRVVGKQRADMYLKQFQDQKLEISRFTLIKLGIISADQNENSRHHC
jgi:hypothetical protein